MPPRTSALIIGTGGREHALGWAIADDVERVYGAQSNVGIDKMPNGIALGLNSKATIDFAVLNRPQLTIIGPEDWLAIGTADRLRASGLAVFGPNAEAARLETSKIFANQLMEELNIPHPITTVLREKRELRDYKLPNPISSIVIKADGLAGGKGVILPSTKQQAVQVMKGMLDGSLFNGAGANGILIQERLTGPEVSAFVITDGRRSLMLPFSQDHKRLREGDEGPNTGGMGAYAPLDESMVSREQQDKIKLIADKTLKGIRDRGTPFQGVLYLGLMLADQYDGEPMVIEYNVRFGDPEAQVILPVLKAAGVDVYDVLRSTEDRLSLTSIPNSRFLGKSALTITIASEGYPDKPKTGDRIDGLIDREYKDVIIFQGATKYRGSDRIDTAGGRVLSVTGMGATVTRAAQSSLNAIGYENNGVRFSGMQYRRDIGKQVREDI